MARALPSRGLKTRLFNALGFLLSISIDFRSFEIADIVLFILLGNTV